jgi:HEAT repeat protein
MGNPAEADRAYMTALESRDPDVRRWAHFTVYRRVETPSEELSDTFLDLWRKGDREAMGSLVNAVITWRLRKAGPLMRNALTDPRSDDEVRSAAARGFGGSGDLTFLPLLRQTATAHPVPIVRANAYEGLGHLLGPESLPDLANGTKDESELVRRYVAVHAYNLAQRARRADVTAQVRQLLETLRDESPGAAEQARYMLAMLAKLAP